MQTGTLKGGTPSSSKQLITGLNPGDNEWWSLAVPDPGTARVKFWSIVDIAYRKCGCDIAVPLHVSPAWVTWQL